MNAFGNITPLGPPLSGLVTFLPDTTKKLLSIRGNLSWFNFVPYPTMWYDDYNIMTSGITQCQGTDISKKEIFNNHNRRT